MWPATTLQFHLHYNLSVISVPQDTFSYIMDLNFFQGLAPLLTSAAHLQGMPRPAVTNKEYHFP